MLYKIALAALLGSSFADKKDLDIKNAILKMNRENAARADVKVTTPVDLMPSTEWDISKATTC